VDEVKGIDPLSENNKDHLCYRASDRAAHSQFGQNGCGFEKPSDRGYGDGNLGTMASIHLRKAGYDAAVVEGKSEKPCYLLIEDDKVQIMDASGLWGKNTFDCQDILEERHGKKYRGPAHRSGGETAFASPLYCLKRERAERSGPGWAPSWARRI